MAAIPLEDDAPLLTPDARRIVRAEGLTLLTGDDGRISVHDADGAEILWLTDPQGLTDGTVAPEVFNVLTGPWEAVTWLDLARPAAVALFNALTGGVEACGAEIVHRDGGLVLLPGPDAESQPLPAGLGIYLCSGSDGDVLALTEEEYRESLGAD